MKTLKKKIYQRINHIDLYNFRANHLLAALAAADMAVFLVMLPYCLASYPIFYNSNTFRSLLGTIKIQIGALANWFSCAAIW